MDCLAQTVDRALTGQTVDRLRKAWIKLAQSVDMRQTVDIREHGSVSLCRDGQKTKWRLQCKY